MGLPFLTVEGRFWIAQNFVVLRHR